MWGFFVGEGFSDVTAGDFGWLTRGSHGTLAHMSASQSQGQYFTEFASLFVGTPINPVVTQAIADSALLTLVGSAGFEFKLGRTFRVPTMVISGADHVRTIGA